MRLSDAELGAWFADFMSAYRAPTLPEISLPRVSERTANAGSADLKAAVKLGERLSAGATLTLAPGMRIIEWQGALHMGGQTINCDAQLLEILSAFYVEITAATWHQLSTVAQLQVLKLKRTDALVFERRAKARL